MIVSFTLGGLVFGRIGVAAVTLTANEVKYTPNNEVSTATNANEALDELYDMVENTTHGEPFSF